MAGRALIQAPGSFGTSARAATGEQLGKIVVGGLEAMTGAMGKAQAQQDALDKENSFIAKSDLVLQRKQFQNQHGYVNLSSDERRKVDDNFYNDPDTLSKLKVLQEDDKNSFLMGQASDEEETLKIEDKEITASHTNMFTQTMTAYIDSNLSQEEFGSILDRTRMMTSKMKPVDQYKQVADIIKAKVKENPADYEKYESYLDVIKDPTLKEEALSTIKKESKVFEQSKAIQSIASGSSSVMDANAKLNTKGIDSIEVNSDMVSKVFNGNQELGIGLANENNLKISQLTNTENLFYASIRKGNQDNILAAAETLINAKDYDKFSTQTKAHIDAMTKLGVEGQGDYALNLIEGHKNPIKVSGKIDKKLKKELEGGFFTDEVDSNLKNAVYQTAKTLISANPDIDPDEAIESAKEAVKKNSIQVNDKSVFIDGVKQSDVDIFLKSKNQSFEAYKDYGQKINNITTSEDGTIYLHKENGGWETIKDGTDFSKQIENEKKNFPIQRSSEPFGSIEGKAATFTPFTLGSVALGTHMHNTISNSFLGQGTNKIIAGYAKFIRDLHSSKPGVYSAGIEELNSYLGEEAGYKLDAFDVMTGSGDAELLYGLIKKANFRITADGSVHIMDTLDFSQADKDRGWTAAIASAILPDTPSKLSLMYTQEEIVGQPQSSGSKKINNLKDTFKSDYNLNVSSSDIAKYNLDKLDPSTEEFSVLVSFIGNQGGDSFSDKILSAQKVLQKAVSHPLYSSIKTIADSSSDKDARGMIGKNFAGQLQDKDSRFNEFFMKTMRGGNVWQK